jgi:hypothetical protein
MLSWVWVHSSIEFNKFEKNKCCADGLLSSSSFKFDEELMMRYELDKFLAAMRKAIHSPDFFQECTTYNNSLSMAATKVCNYCNTTVFTNWGPGSACVMLNG